MVTVRVLGDQGLVSPKSAVVPPSLLSLVWWRVREFLVTCFDAVHSLNHFLFLLSFPGIHPSKMEYEIQQSNLFQIQKKKTKKNKNRDTVYTEKVYLVFST